MDDRVDKLVVLWTSGDRTTAEHMVFMYTLNSKLHNWWEEVTLLIWGAATSLIAVDEDLQKQLPLMRDAGIKLLACKRCADILGVSSKLEDLGIEVKYMGQPFTEILKGDDKLITI